MKKEYREHPEQQPQKSDGHRKGTNRTRGPNGRGEKRRAKPGRQLRVQLDPKLRSGNVHPSSGPENRGSVQPWSQSWSRVHSSPPQSSLSGNSRFGNGDGRWFGHERDGWWTAQYVNGRTSDSSRAGCCRGMADGPATVTADGLVIVRWTVKPVTGTEAATIVDGSGSETGERKSGVERLVTARNPSLVS